MVAGNREGRGGRRDGEGEERGGKGRGGERGRGEETRETMPAAFPLFPPAPPGVPACNKGLAPLLSPLWNHIHRHIPKSLSSRHWGYKGVCHHTWLFTWALRVKLRPSHSLASILPTMLSPQFLKNSSVLKCVCKYMPQHAWGSQRSWFSPFTLGV